MLCLKGKTTDTNKAASDDKTDESGADKTSADQEEKKVWLLPVHHNSCPAESINLLKYLPTGVVC